MMNELLFVDVSCWVLLLQSTLCMVLGLLGSFLLRRQAARAHQALVTLPDEHKATIASCPQGIIKTAFTRAFALRSAVF